VCVGAKTGEATLFVFGSEKAGGILGLGDKTLSWGFACVTTGDICNLCSWASSFSFLVFFGIPGSEISTIAFYAG